MRNGNMFRLESVCTPKEPTCACVEQRAVTCKLTIVFISKCQQKRRKNTFIVGSKKIPSEIYFSLGNQFMHIWIEPFICIRLKYFCHVLITFVKQVRPELELLSCVKWNDGMNLFMHSEILSQLSSGKPPFGKPKRVCEKMSWSKVREDTKNQVNFEEEPLRK